MGCTTFTNRHAPQDPVIGTRPQRQPISHLLISSCAFPHDISALAGVLPQCVMEVLRTPPMASLPVVSPASLGLCAVPPVDPERATQAAPTLHAVPTASGRASKEPARK
jgi:hypothetical protein